MKRHLVGMLLCALASAACSKSQPAAKRDPVAEQEAADEAMAAKLDRLTVDQVAAKIAANDGHTYIFDANYQEVFAKRHVPTAKWVDEVTAAVLPADKTAFLIFYCHDEA
ncbi:MAG TPA: hypothetical protein VGM90_13540 [Kofleriaceae bacterium]|jgi:hypothetical protein